MNISASLETTTTILTAPSALGHLGVAVRGVVVTGIVFGHQTTASVRATLAKTPRPRARRRIGH